MVLKLVESIAVRVVKFAGRSLCCNIHIGRERCPETARGFCAVRLKRTIKIFLMQNDFGFVAVRRLIGHAAAIHLWYFKNDVCAVQRPMAMSQHRDRPPRLSPLYF
jgi:hypothetical protein